MKNNTIIIIIAIIILGILEFTALLKGINGAYLGLVIAAIAGLAGYKIKTALNKVVQ